MQTTAIRETVICHNCGESAIRAVRTSCVPAPFCPCFAPSHSYLLKSSAPVWMGNHKHIVIWLLPSFLCLQYWTNWAPKNYFTAFSWCSPKNEWRYCHFRSLDFTEVTIVFLCKSRKTVYSLNGSRPSRVCSKAGFLELALSSPSSRFCWTWIQMCSTFRLIVTRFLSL